MNPVWFLAAASAFFILWAIWTFNRLVNQRNMLREAWSGIDVQLKRRHSLVPVIVACVEGYRGHERNLFDRIAASRAAATQAKNAREATAAGNELTDGLRRLIAIAEAYPQLKASDGFLELSRQLVEIEEQIQFARRYYNGTAKILNNMIETFPTMLVARSFGFRPADFFEVEAVIERDVPKVKA